MNKFVIKILNTIYVIIRPTKDFIFPNLARRLEKLPTPRLVRLVKPQNCVGVKVRVYQTLCENPLGRILKQQISSKIFGVCLSLTSHVKNIDQMYNAAFNPEGLING